MARLFHCSSLLVCRLLSSASHTETSDPSSECPSWSRSWGVAVGVHALDRRHGHQDCCCRGEVSETFTSPPSPKMDPAVRASVSITDRPRQELVANRGVKESLWHLPARLESITADLQGRSGKSSDCFVAGKSPSGSVLCFLLLPGTAASIPTGARLSCVENFSRMIHRRASKPACLEWIFCCYIWDEFSASDYGIGSRSWILLTNL